MPTKHSKKRREKLKANIIQDPDTVVGLRDRAEKVSSDGILKEAVESEISMLLLDWLDGENSQDGRIFNELVDQILWNAKIPVIASKLKFNIKSLERIVFVVASNTVGVKLNESSVEAALNLAKILDLPFKVLATEHYYERLHEKIKNEKAEKHQQIEKIENEADEILSFTKKSDLVILPSMGSKARFLAESDHLPYLLNRQIESSLAVIHFS